VADDLRTLLNYIVVHYVVPDEQRAIELDASPSGGGATIEDENRNAVILDLEREIRRLGLSVNARYSFFTSQLGAQQTSFRRHVAYLGLTYRFSTR